MYNTLRYIYIYVYMYISITTWWFIPLSYGLVHLWGERPPTIGGMSCSKLLPEGGENFSETSL